jgi:hypothetical protein
MRTGIHLEDCPPEFLAPPNLAPSPKVKRVTLINGLKATVVEATTPSK